MAEEKELFESKRFYTDLDATRAGRNMTWKDVGAEARVNTSTLSRMAQGQRPDATALASLSAWSGLNPADYVSHIERPARADTLTQISSSLSQDESLTPQGKAMIQETIQKLYEALQIKTDNPASSNQAAPRPRK
jgi:hypothetical protein